MTVLQVQVYNSVGHMFFKDIRWLVIGPSINKLIAGLSPKFLIVKKLSSCGLNRIARFKFILVQWT